MQECDQHNSRERPVQQRVVTDEVMIDFGESVRYWKFTLRLIWNSSTKTRNAFINAAKLRASTVRRRSSAVVSVFIYCGELMLLLKKVLKTETAVVNSLGRQIDNVFNFIEREKFEQKRGGRDKRGEP